MRLSSRFIGYSAGLMASFFWGIHSVVIRYLTQQGVDPSLIAGSRLYVGVLTLFILLCIRRVFSKDAKNRLTAKFPFTKLFWLAAISLGVNFLLFQYGLQFTLASDANLIQNFAPVTVLIISTIFFIKRVKEIAPTHKYWMNVFQIVLIGSIGASLVLVNDANNHIVASKVKLFGDLIEFAAMLFFALFVIFSSENMKEIKNVTSGMRTTMIMLAVAAVPVSLFVPFGDFQLLTNSQWLWIIFIGVFPTGIAYWLWHVASKKLNIVPLTLNLIYIGAITVLTEYIFLDISLDWKFILGALLMILASVFADVINQRATKHIQTAKSTS